MEAAEGGLFAEAFSSEFFFGGKNESVAGAAVCDEVMEDADWFRGPERSQMSMAYLA